MRRDESSEEREPALGEIRVQHSGSLIQFQTLEEAEPFSLVTKYTRKMGHSKWIEQPKETVCCEVLKARCRRTTQQKSGVHD